MNEFLKLDWRTKDLTKIDPQICFLSEEAVADSYVYKSFIKPLKAKPKGAVKLKLSNTKYVPGKKYYRSIPRRSLLTKLQKSHCLKAMKLLHSGKNAEIMTASEKYSIKIYRECHSKIVDENQHFLQYIQNVWNSNKDKPLKIKPGISNYSWNHWKNRLQRYLEYPQFYKEIRVLSLNYDENEGTVLYEQKQNLLEMGTLARFSPPNLKEQCILKIVTLPKIDNEAILNSKLPVSQDDNIIKLLETNQFDAVISSSALKQIMDFTNTKAQWAIPVIIKEVENSGDKNNKKIIFIDKVLPVVNPTYHDLKYYAYKQLLKSNFCQYKAFSFPIEEDAIDNATDGKELQEGKEEEEENDESKEEIVKNKKNKQRIIHHNVSYRVWNIKKTDTQNTLMKNKLKDTEIKLLVRCKLDACECTDEGALFPVVLKPKIEQQLQYGANIASKSELSREWTSLFFRIYSNLYRTRIYSPMSEVISVEKCSIQKINSEALTHYDYKPNLGLGVLEKVLEELINLECGNYLLQHLPKHELFLSILKGCEESDASYNLHQECENCGIDSKTQQSWLPIDVNYILPVHEEYEQIPATFQGFDNKSQTDKKKKKTCVKNKKKPPTPQGKTPEGEKDDSL